MPSLVETRREGRVLIVTIARPEARNALNPEAHGELQKIWDDFEKDEDLWIGVITGTGEKAFCAGNDLKLMAQGHRVPFPPGGFGGLTARFGCWKPVIAAVNGAAFAGGFELVLSCDIAVASENATFALSEPKVGVAAVCGGPHRLIRQIPQKAAMAMLLTGAPVDAQEALRLGIVNEVVPQGEALNGALRWAEKILECAPHSVRATKQMALEGLGKPALKDAYFSSYSEINRMFSSRDMLEGPMAFAQKRKPNWTGK